MIMIMAVPINTDKERVCQKCLMFRSAGHNSKGGALNKDIKGITVYMITH